MPQVSTTIPEHLDTFMERLAAELGISKSSLLAMCIEIGLPLYAQTIVDRYRCLDVLDKVAKTKEKELKAGNKGKPAAVTIEYAAATVSE